MGGTGDPGRTVHVDTDIPIAQAPCLSSVDAHADRYLGSRPPVVVMQLSLRPDRRVDGVRYLGEHDEESIALGADLDGILPDEHLAEDRVMSGEHLAVAFTERLQEPSRTFYVGEEEREGSARQRRARLV